MSEVRIQSLLDDVQRLEDEGFLVFLKWDGERNSGKKTLVIQKPGTEVLVRRDSDDMWRSLESALAEVREIQQTQAEEGVDLNA